jgi:hypothetical protein
MLWVDIQMIQGMTAERMMKITTMVMKILKKEEDDDPRYRGAEYHKHSTEDENGQFCVLLQEVLEHLGYTMKLLYVTKHFSEPSMRDYYTSRAYIRVPLIDTNGWRNRSSHHSTTHFSTD